MVYESKLEVIWARLKEEGSQRRPTAFRTTFDNVVAAFLQAEDCEFSPDADDDVKRFRAESNTWYYYFSEEVPFPGIDPATEAIASPESSPTAEQDLVLHKILTIKEAAARRREIQALWVGRWNRKDYTPQLGWNPETGEPFMAVRSYAENSYPALSGEHHRHLKSIEVQMPEFIIQYERFPHLGYTLLWPEFASKQDLKNQGTWRRFAQFRGFLAEWSAHATRAPYSHDALREYLNKPEAERPGLPLPANFSIQNFMGKLLNVMGSAVDRHESKNIAVIQTGADYQETETSTGTTEFMSIGSIEPLERSYSTEKKREDQDLLHRRVKRETRERYPERDEHDRNQ